MGDADGAVEAKAAHAVPRDTTPTWEMELLLSGATVFGLLQLPRELDALFFDAFNRLQEEAAAIVMTLWICAQASLLTVILTFVAHLMLRGYWIALVGLGSVYPGGIRWDRLRMGPHLRAVNEATAPAMPARVEAADNRATRVFSGLTARLFGFRRAIAHGTWTLARVAFREWPVERGFGFALLDAAGERPHAAGRFEAA